LQRYGEGVDEPALTDSAWMVMTLIGLRGESTAYDVKRQLDYFGKEFWAVPHTGVYRECERLCDRGLLAASQEESGRRRRAYSLTDRGQEALVEWVRTPTESTMQIRDIAQVKMMAAELSTKDAVRELATAQARVYRERLARLEALAERFSSPRFRLRTVSISMGRAVYTAAAEFWENVAENPPAELDCSSAAQNSIRFGTATDGSAESRARHD
jgi:DNA-binding PadR family transcriptional regulator